MRMVGGGRVGFSRIDQVMDALTQPTQKLLAVVFAAVLVVGLAGESAAASLCTIGSGTTLVEMQTRHGTTEGLIVVRLCSEDLPVTVDNFLEYVDSGAYTDAGYLHRSDAANHVIQGGGFYIQDDSFSLAVETMDPIGLEKDGFSNVAGTIGMARTGELVSATSQWYFNTANNSPGFDPTPALTSGFQVFGEVIEGMDVVDDIHALDVHMFNDLLANVPVDSDAFGDAFDASEPIPHLVYIDSIVNAPEPAAGVQGAVATLVLAGLAAKRRRSAALYRAAALSRA